MASSFSIIGLMINRKYRREKFGIFRKRLRQLLIIPTALIKIPWYILYGLLYILKMLWISLIYVFSICSKLIKKPTNLKVKSNCFWQLKNTSFGNQKYNYKIGKPAHRF
jgi:hypothetical protein